MKTLLRICVVTLLWTCKTVPDPSSLSYYISEVTSSPARQGSSDCTFRYRLDNTFPKLENQIQQEAVRAAFDLWQEGNPNIGFVQRQDGLAVEMLIRFVDGSQLKNDKKKSTYGLIRGDIATLSSATNEKNTYIVLLDSGFDWDSQSITRVLAYHIGIFLGLDVSPDASSMLHQSFVKGTSRLTEADIAQVQKLYPVACNTSCNNFLPFKLDMLQPVTKSIKLDKQGTISINAGGSMIVGTVLGWSTPLGLEKGLFSFPIGDYSIVRDFWHAALIYKVNNEPNWRSCGTSCEFQTDGVSQCIDITFAVNDNNLTDNQGSYQVTVDYKK